MKRFLLAAMCLAMVGPAAGCIGQEESDEVDDEEEIGQSEDAITVFQWGPDQQVPNLSTSNAPALGAYKGTVHMITTGYGANKALYHQTWNGSSWSNAVAIPGQLSKNRPGLATFGTSKGDQKLHMVHQGETSDDLYWSTFDGSSWTPNSKLPMNSYHPPALASYGGKLHMLLDPLDTSTGDSFLHESTFDGANWSSPVKVLTPSGYGMGSAGHALAVHNGVPVLVYKLSVGQSNYNTLYMSTYTNGSWSNPVKIQGQLSKSTPALASFGGYLHMTHLGDSSNSIWWSYWDGSTWSNNVTIPNQLSRFSPALAASSTQLVQAHIGDSSSLVWSSTFQ